MVGAMKTPTLIVAVLAFTSTSFAVDPPPDGGYPGANTAEGEDALFSLTIGWENTAVGWRSLYLTTTGFQNVAVGNYSLYNNTNGAANTSMGYAAMIGNKSGCQNVAVGYQSLFVNTTACQNVGIGTSALWGNLSGGGNVAIGQQALYYLNGGSFNIAIGYYAGEQITGSNNIAIGHRGYGLQSNTIRIGTEGTHTATYVAGIRQTPLIKGTALAVGITADGQLGVRASSAKFKEAIKPIDKASEAILDLKPVTFRYKKELDPRAAPQFGLVAEEVAKVDPDLVIADDQGKPFTVRYDEVNAMLLNEFLKEHKKVEEQAKTVGAQAKKLEAQASKIERLETALEKMSARLDAKGL